MKTEIILGRIFIAVISVVITFLLLDYVSRWFISSKSPIEKRFPVQCARQPKPYTMFGGKPHGCDNYFNRLGYVEKAPSVPKNYEEFRVFMLGGSTVVNGEPPISTLLEREFVRNGLSHVKVYNFGVVSSVSGQELARIVFEVSELEPDMVILYNGGNDILHPWRWDPRPGYPFNYIAYENNPLLESDVREYPSLTALAFGSNILRKYFSSFFIDTFVPLDKMRKHVNWKTEAWKNKIAAVYVNNLIKSDRVTRSFGAEFIAFFQPLVYYKSNLSDQEELITHRDMEKRDYVLDIRIKILAQIEKAKKTSSAQIIDLSSFYEDVPDHVFTDDIHTKQTYKIMVAKKIFRQIIKYSNMIMKETAETAR